jgi:hypothetical protein
LLTATYLDSSITEFTANQTFGIEDSVTGVHGNLILSGISNKTLGLVEGNVRRGGTITLIVGNDLYTIILPYSDARVCGTEIDAY